jgi:hypothetical protein
MLPQGFSGTKLLPRSLRVQRNMCKGDDDDDDDATATTTTGIYWNLKYSQRR